MHAASPDLLISIQTSFFRSFDLPVRSTFVLICRRLSFDSRYLVPPRSLHTSSPIQTLITMSRMTEQIDHGPEVVRESYQPTLEAVQHSHNVLNVSVDMMLAEAGVCRADLVLRRTNSIVR